MKPYLQKPTKKSSNPRMETPPPPTILDPFAGGGSIPLEAQRLGLEAHASDLNPVAVLINKALIEIPPKWAGQPPVFPGAAEEKMSWPKATGLSEDVRRYGQWMRNEAQKRIGHLYPDAQLSNGESATPVAWLWARSIRCPNPACGALTPLASTWWLSKKKGKPRWLEPLVQDQKVTFVVKSDPSGPADSPKSSRGANFKCVVCSAPMGRDYIHDCFASHEDSNIMLAVVADTRGGREYVAPDDVQDLAAQVMRPSLVPDQECRGTFGGNAQGRRYGFDSFADYYTGRQLQALTTFVELLAEVRHRIETDGDSSIPHSRERAVAVTTYLAFAVSRSSDYWSSLVTWASTGEFLRNTFARQAIPMTWDFAECNPLGGTSGNWLGAVEWVARAIESLPCERQGSVSQLDARRLEMTASTVISTDPPYYDNIGYADLADFFYVWLRLSMRDLYPGLMDTLLTPKADELVADKYRHGGKQEASDFFEEGFNEIFARIRRSIKTDLPTTVFYAFKQSETDDEGTASTGWQTLLEGMLGNGWEVTATWPIRTERQGKITGVNANMLASSIVLVLRPRPEDAESISRRGFVQVLRSELPSRLSELQQGSIAPVDLAQAAIGPGMAVFSRYARVLEADGSDMTVRTALALINQALDEVLNEQEGDFDAETRFSLKWFSQYGWNEAASGEADILTRAVNTTVASLERGGIFRAAAGKARLLEPSGMSTGWNPADDKAISVWEVAVRLGYALQTEGLERAAEWMREASSRVDMDAVKELSYLMYSVCERKGWSESAMLFNALGTSWGDVAGVARTSVPVTSQQSALEFGDDDD